MPAPKPEELICPPTACPAAYQAAIAHWEPEPLGLLKCNLVPWYIIAQLAEDNWTTMRKLGHRFNDDADIDATAPVEFTYGSWDGHQATKRKITFAIKEAVRDAKTIARLRTEAIAIGDLQPHLVMVPGQRESMERAYQVNCNGDKPRLDHQGSDHFLGQLWKDLNKGSLGTYSNKEITAKIPDEATFLHSVKIKTRSRDGTMKEHDHEERNAPGTWDAWKKQMQVFCTSLLMAIFANQHQTQFQISKQKLDDFYAWLYGSDIADRHNPPSLQTIMAAERLAWRRIALAMHKGETLATALADIKGNALFWQNEICDRTSSGRGGGDHQAQQQGYQRHTPDGYHTPQRKRNRSGNWNAVDSTPSSRYRTPSPANTWNRWDRASGTPPAAVLTAGPGKGKGYGNTTPKGKGRGGKPDKKGKDGKGSKGGGKQGKKGTGKMASTNDKGKFYCWDWNRGGPEACPDPPACGKIHRCAKPMNDGRACNGRHQIGECTSGG
jgi:hypothetical protein